jgi:hypothetical protein
MAWMLQGNPERFDIGTYIKQPRVYWLVNRYVTEVRIADHVFLWQSGIDGGVVAYGHIDELPTARAQVKYPAQLGDSLWHDTIPEATMKVVGVRLVRTIHDGYAVSRAVAQADAVLQTLDVLQMPQATVFRCTDEQAVRLLA